MMYFAFCTCLDAVGITDSDWLEWRVSRDQRLLQASLLKQHHHHHHHHHHCRHRHQCFKSIFVSLVDIIMAWSHGKVCSIHLPEIVQKNNNLCRQKVFTLIFDQHNDDDDDDDDHHHHGRFIPGWFIWQGAAARSSGWRTRLSTVHQRNALQTNAIFCCTANKWTANNKWSAVQTCETEILPSALD